MVGKSLSHYKILEELGRGGMGIVYKGEDTKLHRTVAIKVLPAAALSSDDDRARFYREARAAASLSHPNIATVYEIDEAVPEGSKDDDLRPFIAMEFIEGDTLEDRIKQGPMKLEGAVRIASEIASALEAAHENNIVHRDIKAANVMLTAKGSVKVLDFGLAQTAQSTKLTRMGSTLGTVAYMSPEQARGEEVDGRADIWALGVTLYEMIAGRHPFAGDYEQAVVYSILNEEPEPLTAIRTGVPMSVEWIINKCLAKSAADRYQSAKELLVDLRTGQTKVSSSSKSVIRESNTLTSTATKGFFTRHRGIALMTILSLGFFLLGVLFSSIRQAGESDSIRRYALTMPGLSIASVSPLGDRTAYVRSDSLWIQGENSFDPVLAVSDETNIDRLCWSPDGTELAYVSESDIYKVDAEGASVTFIASFTPLSVRGCTWTGDGELLISAVPGRLDGKMFRVPSTGGTPELIRSADPSRKELNFQSLLWISSSDRVLVEVELDDTHLELQYLDDENNTPLASSWKGFEGLTFSMSGHVLFEQTGTGTWALNLSEISKISDNLPIFVSGNTISPSISNDGQLVLVEKIPVERQFGWYSRNGRLVEMVGIRHSDLRYPTLSSDGRRFGYSLEGDVWIRDLETGNSDRLSSSDADEFPNLFIPGTYELMGVSYRSGLGDIYGWKGGSRNPQLYLGDEKGEFTPSMPNDHSSIVYYVVDPETLRDLYHVKTAMVDDSLVFLSDPEPLLVTPFQERSPIIDPTGTRVAYLSNRTGSYQLYVRSYPDGDQDIPVSSDGARAPLWNSDGTELFYTNDQATLMLIDIPAGRTMNPRRPVPLFNLRELNVETFGIGARKIAYDPTRDQFIFPVQVEGSVPERMLIIENWAQSLKDE